MGDIQMQITIPNDNDGFTLLKCELCGGYFKLRPSEIQDDSVIYVWCPNCGLLSESYITDDVIDLAMKISKIKEMSSPELEKELSELKTELFKLRFSLATHGLDNPMRIKEVRKDIARINTVLTERKIAESKNA